MRDCMCDWAFLYFFAGHSLETRWVGAKCARLYVILNTHIPYILAGHAIGTRQVGHI